MTQDAQLNLIIDLKTRLDEVRQAQREALGLKANLDSLNSTAAAIGKGFVSGLGVGGALTVLGAVKTAVSDVVGEMRSLVQEGVNTNKIYETATIGIAGAMRNFDPERFRSLSQALGGSAIVVEELKRKSADLGIRFDSIADSYRANFGAMLKGGVFDLQKQIDLTVTLQRTMIAFFIKL
jgi:hypothetical protein